MTTEQTDKDDEMWSNHGRASKSIPYFFFHFLQKHKSVQQKHKMFFILIPSIILWTLRFVLAPKLGAITLDL